MTAKKRLLTVLGPWLAACSQPSPSGVAMASTATASAGPLIGPSATATATVLTPSARPLDRASASLPIDEPNPQSEPWTVGDASGAGIAGKDTKNPRGENVFVGFAGYKIPLEAAEAWVERLYEDDLRARGVRYVYAVQGPADVWYDGGEIGTETLGKEIAGEVSPRTHFIVFAAHSSGAYVAHALLDQLAGGLDPSGATAHRIVYFDLDGGDRRLTDRGVALLRRAYFVSAVDPASMNHTPHRDQMKKVAAQYPNNGAYLEEVAKGTHCDAAANWCMHMALITSLPHDRSKAGGPKDYTDFTGRSVAHGYIDETAQEAGLDP